MEWTLVGSVLHGADDVVAAFVQSRIPHLNGQPFRDFRAFGIVRGADLVGGVVFTNHRPNLYGDDIDVSIAVDPSDWCRPSILRALFSYPFGFLPCARLTAYVGRKNKRSRKFCEGLGFKLEGVRRKAADGREDLMYYGMLRDECRWIRK